MICLQWWIQYFPEARGANPKGGALADLRGRQGRVPPLGPDSFIFMQFSVKIWPNDRLVPPPWKLANHPPSGKFWIRHWEANLLFGQFFSENSVKMMNFWPLDLSLVKDIFNEWRTDLHVALCWLFLYLIYFIFWFPAFKDVLIHSVPTFVYYFFLLPNLKFNCKM